ncbi:MAG: 4Fe-4S binding protein [Syntrophaceae bacterium]|nr:4Fe-4S binding protein [Syntrophaceae bacterium]
MGVVKMGSMIYLKDVATLALDSQKCTGCGMCLEVCPHGVFKMNGQGLQIADRNACMECGACSRNCPAGAISVQSGVGCAAAVINSMLGRNGGECCCGPQTGQNQTAKSGGCCC